MATFMTSLNIWDVSQSFKFKQWYEVARSCGGGHQLKTEQLSVSNHDWCSAWKRCSPQVRSFIFVLVWSPHMTKFDQHANQLDPHRTSWFKYFIIIIGPQGSFGQRWSGGSFVGTVKVDRSHFFFIFVYIYIKICICIYLYLYSYFYICQGGPLSWWRLL